MARFISATSFIVQQRFRFTGRPALVASNQENRESYGTAAKNVAEISRPFQILETNQCARLPANIIRPTRSAGMCGSPLTFSRYGQTLRARSCVYARRALDDATHERVRARMLIRQADLDATNRGLVADVHNAEASPFSARISLDRLEILGLLTPHTW